MFRNWKELRDSWDTRPSNILSDHGIWTVPTEVFGLCAKLKIPLYLVHNKVSWTSYVSSTNTHAKIWVNGSLSEIEQRWATAHALGHLFKHPLNQRYECGGHKELDSYQEQEADKFAFELLIPAHLLLARSAWYGRDPVALGQIFGVAPEHMLKRMRDLEITGV